MLPPTPAGSAGVVPLLSGAAELPATTEPAVDVLGLAADVAAVVVLDALALAEADALALAEGDAEAVGQLPFLIADAAALACVTHAAGSGA